VIASAELRLKRIMIRDGLTREDALLRMGAQHDDDFYVSRSRYILRNEGSEYALAAQTRAILDEIGLLGEAGP
jgi:dephospho-CoA kinase